MNFRPGANMGIFKAGRSRTRHVGVRVAGQQPGSKPSHVREGDYQGSTTSRGSAGILPMPPRLRENVA